MQKISKVRAALRRLDGIVVAISLVLLLFFAACVGVLWRLDVFDANTRASNAQIIAAALTLVGVLVTASLTFVGVILKHSLDARTEGRLRLETSIRAVELLTEDGKPATPTRQAGALFVLANLNQLDFALALLGQMWANREVSPGAAVWVVNRLLLGGDESLQHQAAALLYANADTLSTSAGYEYPECVNLTWTNDLPTQAREWLVSALVKLLVSRERHDWDDADINAVVVQLDLIRRADKASHVRNGALVCLDALLDVVEFVPGIKLFVGDGQLDVDTMIADVKRLVGGVGEDVPSVQSDLAATIRTGWAAG